LQGIPHLNRIDEADLIKLLRTGEASLEITESILPELANTMIIVWNISSKIMQNRALGYIQKRDDISHIAEANIADNISYIGGITSAT
jgi:hypothetical protein